MFKILLAFFDEPSKTELKKLCLDMHDISIYEADTDEHWQNIFNEHTFDCFIISFDVYFSATRKYVQRIRDEQGYQFIPILLFSSQIEYLLSGLIMWRCCEFFLRPLIQERRDILSGLLHFYVDACNKMRAKQNKFLQIETPKEILNLPLTDILFIESAMKKSVVHLKDGDISFSVPLYRIKEQIEGDSFVQTHRSFIVNIENISFVDKRSEPWIVSFFHSTKAAYISRSYKKDVNHTLHHSFAAHKKIQVEGDSI